MVDVLEVAEDWSYWSRPVPESANRDLDWPQKLSQRLALIVKGVRRSGKSTLLAQMIDRYSLKKEHCVFINFEDPRLSSSLNYQTLDELVKAFRARHPPRTRVTYFLDEIQSVKGWERWLRTRLERPAPEHFVVTGSNANLLSGELGSALTGRHISIELFPMSLTEVRRLKKHTSLSTYLSKGGFPEIYRQREPERLLRQYFFDIVERDVRERVALRASGILQQLVQMVFESAGSELSLRRAAGAIGIAVDTVKSYLEACEDAYMLFSCPYFAFSERRRASMPKKYYPIDVGLCRAVTTRAGQNLGKTLECATFIALKKKYGRVAYWRGKGEVDFVIQDDTGRPTPFQVTLQSPQARHLNALIEFYETFPMAREAVFVTTKNFESLFA